MANSENSTERKHHPFSPSTLQFREVCACYDGHDSANEAAIQGTLAHGVVEAGEDDLALGDNHATWAAECLDFYEHRKKLFLEARKRDAKDQAKPPAEVLEITEAYLPVDDCKFGDVDSTTAGYVDKVLINHTRDYAEMFDWKFGVWPVEAAENNLQGFAYTLGLWKQYPEIEKIRFIFKQPALNRISTACFSRDQKPEMYRRIQAVVARAREARKEGKFTAANPSIPTCNFCKHIGICPKVTAMACQIGAKFDPVQIPADITPTQVLDPKESAMGIKLASVMKTWAEAFRGVITSRVLALQAPCPPGYKIQQGTGRREIVDTIAFRKIALRHVTEEELDKAATYTFGPLEEAVKEHAPRGTKTAAVDSFKKDLELSGCVKKGDPYYFLKAEPKSQDEKNPIN